MIRILLGVVAALVLAISAMWYRLESVTERANTAESANKAQKQVIDAIGTEVAEQAAAAVDARRRDLASRNKAAKAQAELEKLKRDNQEIREYLASGVPPAVADWMWPLPGKDGNKIPLPSSGIPGANTEAGLPAWTGDTRSWVGLVQSGGGKR